MKDLNRVLRDKESLLDAQRAELLPSTPKSKSVRQVLELFVHLPSTERHCAVSDLEDITRNLHDKRRNAKHAFKLVWYLYTVSHKKSLSISPMVPETRDPANAALDLVQSDFINHPFAVCRPAQSPSRSPFLILNRDHETATRKEDLAKKLGGDWTIDHLRSRDTSPTTLLEAQITLFELIWSGTVQHLKTNPTHHAEDPEYQELHQTLDQLDKILQEQEAIARSLEW